MTEYNLPSVYTEASDVSPREIVDLRESVAVQANWAIRDESFWFKTMRQSIAYVGIRHESGLLVAYGDLRPGGDLKPEPRDQFASIGFQAVRTGYQREGLGKYTLKRLVGIADEEGVTSLFCTLLPSNTIKQAYIDEGFSEHEDTGTFFRRHGGL